MYVNILNQFPSDNSAATSNMISRERTSRHVSTHHECPPGDFCNERLCPFTLSRDADYLSDLTDRRRDPVFHRNLWKHFWFPSVRTKVSAEEAATYAAKFDRCQRFDDKRKQIADEVDANRNGFLNSLSKTAPKRVLSEAEIKAVRERNLQRLKKDMAELRKTKENRTLAIR